MNRVSRTLFLYIGRRFLVGIGGATLIFVVLLMSGDVVEMLRDYGSRDELNALTAFGLSLLKLPHLIERAFPFMVLGGALWTFRQLSRNNELVVARASGVSAWQFLAPAIAMALGGGIFMVTIFNPLAAATIDRYSEFETTVLRGEASRLSIGKTGLWLRQAYDGSQTVIHATDVTDDSETGLQLRNVIVFRFTGADKFSSRIDAREAVLGSAAWDLTDAWVAEGGAEKPVFHRTYRIPTGLTRDSIQDSFAQPETLSFWELPSFIRTAELAGFSVNEHRVHLHWLWSLPLFLIAMVLIAATFSLRVSRMGGTAQLVVYGLLTAFGLYVFAGFIHTLGESGIFPPALAAWAPSVIASLGGLWAVFYLEDG